MLPTREEISGRRKRILRYGGTTFEYEFTLAEVCYFSEWTGFEDGTTVHDITEQSLKNAFAAGYNLPQLSFTPNTNFTVLQSHKEVEEAVYNALGSYTISGSPDDVKDVLIDTAAKMHFDNDTRNLQHLVKHIDTHKITLQPSKVLHKEKAKNKFYDVETNTFTGQATHIHVVRDKLHFTASNTNYYIKIDEVSDMNDVWPCQDGIRNIDARPIVVGAGQIIQTPRKRIFTRQKGVWIDGPVGMVSNDYITGLHTERSTEYFTKSETAFRSFVTTTHKLGKYVVQYESSETNQTPLGLDNTFWRYVDLPKWSSTKSNLEQFKARIQKRKKDPLNDVPSKPPDYGIILKKTNTKFRLAQQHALDLMFRNNKIHSGIYILPCGAGKTLLGIAAAVRRGGRTLVITPGQTIARQWRTSFIKYANVWPISVKHIGRMRGAEADRLFFHQKSQPVVILTIGELSYNATDQNKTIETGRTNTYKLTAQERIEFCDWDLVIYDECHEMRTDQRMPALNKLSFKTFIGLTATLLDKSSNINPWHVDVAPVMYETGWPIRHAQLIKVPCCHPFQQQLVNTDRQPTGQVNSTKNNLASQVIHHTYKKLKRQDGGIFKWCLKMNPRKLQRIKEIVDRHMGQGEPIALFSTSLDFIEWIKRTLITKAAPSYHREYFGEYLREKFDAYKDELKNEFTHIPDPIRRSEQIASLIEKEEQKVKDILNKDLKDVTKVSEEQYYSLLYILKPPIIAATGETKQQLRNIMYREFEKGNIKCLIQSKIGNTGVDIPSCRVVITADFDGANMSEDAQRFGRGLRDADDPTKGQRYFYTVYTDLGEGEFNDEKYTAEERLKFLRSRGYPCIESKDTSTCVDNNSLRKKGNSIHIGTDFYMTPHILNQMKQMAPVRLLIQTHGLREEVCELNGRGATFHRTEKYENNLLMAEYICKYFGIKKVAIQQYRDVDVGGDIPMDIDVDVREDRDVDVGGDIPMDIDVDVREDPDVDVGGDIPMEDRDVDVGGDIPMNMDVNVGEEISFFRQLVGKDTRVVKYGGMLLSHVNALRQYAHDVRKCRSQGLEFHNPRVKGYIYGDDDAVYVVDKCTTSEKELLQKSRGYDVYVIQ